MAFDIERPGVWFGEMPTESASKLWAVARSAAHSERQRILAICELLKAGNFAARGELQDLLRSSQDRVVRQFGLRLFCYVARHEDLSFLGELLEAEDPDDAQTLATYAHHTLSPHVVPYLFALLEECTDDSLREDIACSIQLAHPVRQEVDPTIEFEILRGIYENFAVQLTDSYSLGGKPAFAGDLTKSLITAAAQARPERIQLRRMEEPTLLSVWSGLQCPVDYMSVVDDAAFQAVMDYAKSIAAIPWQRGKKYFYGHVIDN